MVRCTKLPCQRTCKDNWSPFASTTLTESSTPQQLQHFQTQQRILQQHQQMQREQSDMEMNGRPGTPADGDNGGSPSKRPRLDGQQFNGAIGPNGRVQGIPGSQQQMLMQSGFNPNNLNQAQFRQNGVMQQKGMPVGRLEYENGLH